MKEQVQETGVRKWFGDDFINMQNELMSAFTAIVRDYGSSILSGCTVTDNGNGTLTLSDGWVFLLDSTGANGRICRVYQTTIITTSWPIYLVQASRDRTTIAAYGRQYKDGSTKNIIVEYFANIQTTQPAHANYIEIDEYGQSNSNFFEAIQTASRRFVSDFEKSTWNNKAEGNHGHNNATTSVPGFMSATDKTKLDTVATNANNYTHPANHAPSIITQDASNRFVTDTEKTTWNGKLNAADSVSTNTGNKTVKRDASGNFSAGTITVTDVIIA